MAFPFSPAALADLTRAAIGQVLETAAAAATVPVRVMGLLGQAELLVSRITLIADQAEALVERVGVIATAAESTVADARLITASAARTVEHAEAITGGAAGVVDRTGEVSAQAVAAIKQVERATADAAELLELYAGTLRKGAPLAARFVEELSPEEVTAAIRLVDQLPRLRVHLVDDVLPLLGKLDQVGPDLHKLLEVTEDLRLAIAGLPGLKMLRRRGEDRVDEANGR